MADDGDAAGGVPGGGGGGAGGGRRRQAGGRGVAAVTGSLRRAGRIYSADGRPGDIPGRPAASGEAARRDDDSGAERVPGEVRQ